MKQTRPIQTTGRIGGVLCLDLINTVGELDKKTGKPAERLNTYDDLLTWSIEGEIETEETGKQMKEAAAKRPDDTERALHRAREIREMLYRLFGRVAEQKRPVERDLQDFNRVYSEVAAQTYITPQNDGYIWAWREDDALDRMLRPVIRSAAELMTSPDISRVKACAGQDCRWLFLDVSKNKSRRWCDMKDCGNRHKARRHYARRQVGR